MSRPPRLRRREAAIGVIYLLGRAATPGAAETREFLSRNGVAFRCVEIDDDPLAPFSPPAGRGTTCASVRVLTLVAVRLARARQCGEAELLERKPATFCRRTWRPEDVRASVERTGRRRDEFDVPRQLTVPLDLSSRHHAAVVARETDKTL